MTPEALETILHTWTMILTYFGGGTAILCALIAWLGKVQMGRILEAQKGEQAQSLEHVRAEFQRDLSKVETELAIYKDKTLSAHRDKVDLYQMAIVPFTELLALIHRGKLNEADLDAFERERLKIHCHLAMFAPQEVFDAYADLIDFLYDSFEGKVPYDFHQVRLKGLALLTRIRADIGYRSDEVVYKGRR